MVPFDISVLQSVYPGCKQITDKARRLVAEGRIIRLKKDLYVACAENYLVNWWPTIYMAHLMFR